MEYTFEQDRETAIALRSAELAVDSGADDALLDLAIAQTHRDDLEASFHRLLHRVIVLP